MVENKLMDVTEAAEYLSIKKSSIYQLTMKRAIPVIKVGRLVRFTKSDLDKFIEQNRQEPENALELPTL